MLRIAATVARRAAAPAPRLAAQFARPSFAAPRLRSFASSAPRRDAEQPQPTDGEQQLHSKLLEKLPGAKVAVQDVSGGCGSFYAISVEHESFKGLTMIKQHRLVNDLLKDDIKGMHGLQLKTRAP
ncbi:hypothetical protein JCM8202_004893 [Rhodotorula sphaerocarpa]